MDSPQNQSFADPAKASETPPGMPAIPGIHMEEALARFAGDQMRYAHWLTDFIEHGPAAAAQIRQAITNGTIDTAISLVHALKGRTGMLGMVELHAICLTLEMALRNNEPAALWLEELETTTAAMGSALKATFKTG